MSESSGSPLAGLSKQAVEGLRAKMGGALREAIASEASRLTGVSAEEKAAREFAKTPSGKLVNTVMAGVARTVAPIIKRINERIDALESRPALHDGGVWNKAKVYAAGAVVTHQGSAWAAQTGSQGVQPGDGVFWRLMIKSRGRP